jgi:SpoVK/Ycf46/Vps4 family AAA+-type ATPase
LPLLRLDMGRVFGGIVGQSEANLRSVIRTAEAIAPCVLWIDEIEKGFGGSTGSGSSDGGTSSRVFGSFLSWMQEKERPVFVVATANDVSQLPPEFLRKGRFDEMFFVDLPDSKERTAIWEIVIARHKRDPKTQDLGALAKATDGFTGAEIEGAYGEALHEAFADGREPTAADIQSAIATTTPVSKLMEERIDALRTWSKGRAREAGAAATKPAPSTPRTSRRVQSCN